MAPTVVAVRSRIRETRDTFTLTLDSPITHYSPLNQQFRPGQFNMLYVFGVGEVPISVSGDAARSGTLVHTIRAVGFVTNALAKLRRGDAVGIRGPFGSSWPLDASEGHDVVIVTGGIGLAPLRPAIYHLLRNRRKFGRICLLYGARTPADLLYVKELEKWGGRFESQVLLTVDLADASWNGHVGVVTTLFPQADFDPTKTIGLMCGPEVMMRFTLREFEKRGVSDDRLYVSLERNMQCAIGFCGHCQFGPHFVCMNGPVFRCDRIKNFLAIREV
jgi:NAD(P)H-flavin reductase